MELRQLRYFLTVAETLHFNRAAKLLRMTQQPLSYQIKRLEDELGFKLFERTTRAVILTPAGMAFQTEVRAGLSRIDRGVDLARRFARGEDGMLNIGYASVTLYSVLPAIVRQFRERFPQVEVVLTEMIELERDALKQQLLNEDVDVGLLAWTGQRIPGLAQESIYQEAVVVALPKSHPLVQRKKISLHELADQQFVMYARRAQRQIFDEFIALSHLSGFSPTIIQEAATGPALVSLVAAGLGVALVPKSLSSLQPDEVVYRPLSNPPLKIESLLIWKESRQLPWLDELRQIAREVGQQLAVHEPR